MVCPTPPAYPYSVVGQIEMDHAYICSGSLIGPNKVLTAGHCVYERDNNGGGVRRGVCVRGAGGGGGGVGWQRGSEWGKVQGAWAR